MNKNDIINLFSSLEKLSWKNDIENKTIFTIAKKYFDQQIGLTKGRKLIRLVGQSGSGKTTQLLPTSKKYFEKINAKPLHLCVREFAKFHPKYEEVLKGFGESQIREKTNGFALRVLIACLYFAMKDGVDIILEVTFLNCEFEEFLLNLIENSKYSVILFCVAVNKKISNKLIQKREKDDSNESGRVVYKTSSDFFYKSMKKGIIFLIKNLPNERIIIWNIYESDCKYDGKIGDCLDCYINEKKIFSRIKKDPDKLLNSKIDYILSKI